MIPYNVLNSNMNEVLDFLDNDIIHFISGRGNGKYLYSKYIQELSVYRFLNRYTLEKFLETSPCYIKNFKKNRIDEIIDEKLVEIFDDIESSGKIIQTRFLSIGEKNKNNRITDIVKMNKDRFIDNDLFIKYGEDFIINNLVRPAYAESISQFCDSLIGKNRMKGDYYG